MTYRRFAFPVTTSIAIAAAALAFPTAAQAQPTQREIVQSQEHTQAQATAQAPTPVKDIERATDRAGKYDPFAIEYNPLGLFVGGRFSATLEWVPIVHNAIVVSPHIIHTSADVATSGDTFSSQTFSGVGTEIGYRYYTGHRGMNGIFIGPSLIVGAYNASLISGDQAFADVGIAADVGVKEILFNHLSVGAGAGLEYLNVSHNFGDLPTGPSTIASTGVKPRVLAEVGYAF